MLGSALGTTASFLGWHHDYFDVGICWGVGHLDEGRHWVFGSVSPRWAGGRLALSLVTIFDAVFGAIFGAVLGAIFASIFAPTFGAIFGTWLVAEPL